MAALVPESVRAIFFDAVGTLLFPEPSAIEVYRAAAARRGLLLSSDEIRSRFIAAYQAEEATDQSANWITSEPREEMRWRRIVGTTLKGVADPDACFRELFEHFARPQAWRVNPDAEFVLARLRERSLVLGIGSNYDSRLLSVLEGIPALRNGSRPGGHYSRALASANRLGSFFAKWPARRMRGERSPFRGR